MQPTLYTIGHSTRSIEQLIDMLKNQHINVLVDVRTIPKSRRYPWFNQEALALTLKKNQIHYLHQKELGGLRKSHQDSINLGWHNLSFRGYADYMQTPEFNLALDELNKLLIPANKVCIMCAEAVPWRCHRSLIGDAELARDIEVIDIINLNTTQPHKLTSFAVIDKSKTPVRVYYPSLQDQLPLKF